MKRIALVVTLLIAFLALCNLMPIPYSVARPFVSPELTPPFRPTPTGWPNAPFSWQKREPRTIERVRGWAVEMIPIR